MTAGNILAAAGLTKAFPGAGSRPTPAVLDVTFELRRNEVLAVIGPNGAGKTTLIDLLSTLLTPSAGTLRIGTVDALREPGAARQTIGYLPAGGRSLYPRLTVLQNLEFFAALHGMCRIDSRPRAEAALRGCGALESAGTRVDRLSDGTVARVSLARAILHDPSLLLLDEPGRSIDPVHRPAILQLLRRFADQPGKAIVLVTHDLDDVFEIADRVALMRDGRIVRLSQVASARQDGAAFAAVLDGAEA